MGEDAQESQVGDIRALYGVTMLGPPGWEAVELSPAWSATRGPDVGNALLDSPGVWPEPEA